MRAKTLLAGVVCLAASALLAQDPVKVDAKHYKVEFENDQVRVLRIHYGPHEKSVMHEHPDGVAVFLTEQKGKFTLGNGQTVERLEDRGGAVDSGGEALAGEPERQTLELLLVELKPKRATTTPRTK